MTNRTHGEHADALDLLANKLMTWDGHEKRSLMAAATALREMEGTVILNQDDSQVISISFNGQPFLPEMEGTRIEGCEITFVSWNNYGCLELLIRLPQGPMPHEVKVTDLAILILTDPREKNDGD